MPHPRVLSAILLPGILTTLLLSLTSCAVEKADTENPATVAATIQLPETEAGMALAEALDVARQTNRNVFAHTGADW